MRKRHVFAALAAFLAVTSAGQAPALAQSALAVAEAPRPGDGQALAVARRYVDAYSAADWDGMAPVMSEDFVFVDRTNAELAGQEFRGRDAALAMFREFGQQGRIVGLFLDFPVVFESQGVVVFSGHVNTLSRAAEPGYGLRWRAEQVIILTVRDGQVVRHEDYANYSAPVITRERLDGGT